MLTLILTALRTVRTVFTAEFVAGLVHWFEDAYVREDTPLVGKYVARPNIVHHHYGPGPEWLAEYRRTAGK